MSDVLVELPVEEVSEGLKYKNCRALNVFRYSDNYAVGRAIKSLCEIIDYRGFLAEKQGKVLVLDLYHCYKGDKTRYIKFYLSPNSYETVDRYNHFNISYDVVKQLTTRLYANKYIELKKGFKDFKSEHVECSKMKATEKLITFLEVEHGVKPSMVRTWKDQEVIILKEPTKKVKVGNRYIKIKKKKTYPESRKTKDMRRVVVKYNELLEKTYIDIDTDGFRYVRKIKSSDKDNRRKHDSLRIDLSLKRSYRVFTGDFDNGGRFYGPWWQGCPEALRSRITINGDYTVEFDFSGLHIHLLYALLGLKLGDKEPYIYPKNNDSHKLRKIYKLILLTSVNCGSDVECLIAVEDQLVDDMEEEPDKYPEEMPDLKAMLKELKDHHKPISGFINKKSGLRLQNIDSSIVEEVIKQMTSLSIPVLSVHDSFICREEDAEKVHATMKKAYLEVVLKEIGKIKSKKLNLSLDEIFTTACFDSRKIFQPYRRLNTQEAGTKEIQAKKLINTINKMDKQENKVIKYKDSSSQTSLLKLKDFKFHETNHYEIHQKGNLTKNMKIATWCHVLKNSYANRHVKFVISGNPKVNEVIMLKPIVLYL